VAHSLVTREFQGESFSAQFISENSQYTDLVMVSGVDGFVFSVDPLYKVGNLTK